MEILGLGRTDGLAVPAGVVPDDLAALVLGAGRARGLVLGLGLSRAGGGRGDGRGRNRVVGAAEAIRAVQGLGARKPLGGRSVEVVRLRVVRAVRQRLPPERLVVRDDDADGTGTGCKSTASVASSRQYARGSY